ncbi:MAG: hypothetical protein NVS2B12_38560 [Ktedonobacteraceae bacterium]
MKSRNTKDTMRSEQHQFVETQTTEDLFLDMAGIAGVAGVTEIEIQSTFSTLFSCFNDRISTADRETLSFCLRHLFYHTHQVYTLFLPEMTTCTEESAQIETAYAHMLTMPMRNMPLKNVNVQYRLWSLLQEIEATLSRMAPLCQLVISAATNVIADLDRSCSIPVNAQQQRAYERACTQQSEHRKDGKHTQHQHIFNDQNDATSAAGAEWLLESSQMIQKTESWLQHNQARLSFSVQFSILRPMIPTLIQIDGGLDDLLRSVYAIFANILPACLKSPARADEQITTLLLDISQRCDQILLQIGILVEPLRLLMGQYTLETMLQ